MEGKITIFEVILASIVRPVFNFIYPPIGEAIEQAQYQALPVRLLTAQDYVNLRRRGIINQETYLNRLSRMGIDNFEAERLYQLSENLPSVGDLIEFTLRGIITPETYVEEMSKLGFSPFLISKFLEASEKLLSPEIVIRAMWRGLYLEGSLEKLKNELKKQGWSEEKINLYEKVSRFYPSPDDFIRFMVRDTFNEEIVRKYGYDEDYPKEIESFVQKSGVDPEWVRHFWRSHWVLPSPTMGYEMLHRGIITKEELNDLLKIADYPPFWREKLIRLSYEPFTRVDIRRMYKLGILTREEVKKAYQEIGYDEEKAEKLTEFTIRDVKEERKVENKEITEPTRSAILQQYKLRLINRNQAMELLKNLDYSEEIADFYLDIVDYQLEEEKIEKYISAYRKLYLNDLVSDNDVIQFLNKLNLPDEYISNLIFLWDIEKIPKPSLPSKTDLTDWYKKGLISDEEFIQEMKKLNYDDYYIDLYLRSIKTKTKR